MGILLNLDKTWFSKMLKQSKFLKKKSYAPLQKSGKYKSIDPMSDWPLETNFFNKCMVARGLWPTHSWPKVQFLWNNYITTFSYTANIYSQFTVIGCVTCATVILQWLLQARTVHVTFNETEEYSLRSIAILGCNIYSQIAVGHVTLPKAVLSTVKIFAV